jgi:hypothetical protein
MYSGHERNLRHHTTSGAEFLHSIHHQRARHDDSAPGGNKTAQPLDH